MLDRLETAPGWIKGLLGLLGVGLFIQLAGLTFNNDGSRYATQVYLALLLPSLVLLVWLRGVVDFWKQLPAALLLLLLGWMLWVGGLYEGSDKDFGYWLKVVVLLLLYVLAVATLVRNEQRFAWVIVAAVAVTALFAWLTLYYQFGVLDRPLEYSKIRWTRLREMGWNGFADLDHPIVAGLYYGLLALLLTWLFVRFKVNAWQTALLAVGMTGLLFYVLFTFSRGAWFSVLAGGFVLLLLFPNRKSYSLLGLGVLLIGLALYLFWPEIQNERRVGINGRDFTWTEWLRRLPDFWLLGAGAGADFIFKLPTGFPIKHAHSLYLQLWFEYGIVGILLFAALLISLLWKGWVCRAAPLARLGLALLVFAMVAMVSDVYAIFTRPGPYWVLFWFPVGILLGVQKPEAERVG